MNNEKHETSKPKNNLTQRGPMRFMGGPEKPKDFKGTLKRLIKYLSKYKISLTIVFVCAILSTVFMIVGPKILGNATTIIFEGIMNQIAENGKTIDFDAIKKIVYTLLGLYIISTVFSYLQGYLMTGISMKITYNLRKEIQSKIKKLPLKYFDKTSFGEVLSYITNDIDVISQNLNQGVTQIITSATTILGILIMMFSISWQMSIVAILVLPVTFTFIIFVVKKSQKYFKSLQEYLGHLNGHIEEVYSNHNIVKIFNGDKVSLDKFDEYNDKMYKSSWKSQFLSGLMMPITNSIANFGYVIICILGGYMASQGRITIGNIQSFIQYMRSFTQPVAQLANISNVLQSTTAAAERVFNFIGEEEELEDTQNPVSVKDIKGDVEFKNVNFGYNENETVIYDFSAKILKGQKIAIVGPTGAGKTTIVKLLMRYYDTTCGDIKIDGINIKDFARKDLRSLFAMVLQDTWTFNSTIMENIRYGNLDATDEEVYEAAEQAQVDHFVKTLPLGYNMMLNEESSNVSGGQKQLLTIARAFLANPKILILDEATSSVDTRTEVHIQEAMEKLMKNRTSFIIAHRLSTIKKADNIIVMDKGDIVEIGTHEELIAKKGFYEKLYNSQFEN